MALLLLSAWIMGSFACKKQGISIQPRNGEENIFRVRAIYCTVVLASRLRPFGIDL